MNPARISLAALALPVLAGMAWMATAGAPTHFLVVNAGALLLAAMWLWFGWIPRRLSQRRGLTLALLAILILFSGRTDAEEKEEIDTDEPFDAFAGGYPVPPRPGQVLPELAGVVTVPAGAAEDKEGEEN